ncbi:MAG: mechanosensitive ion channel family protein [Candidatus Woesearchaeota archaeon]
MVFEDLASYLFLGNNGQEWAYAIGVFLAVILALYIVRFTFLKWFERLAKKTATDIDDMLIEMLKAIHWPFYWVIAAWSGLKYLTAHPVVDQVINSILMIVLIFYAIRATGKIVDHVAERAAKRRAKESNLVYDKVAKDPIVNVLSLFVKGILWAVGVVWLLANMGFNVASLLAGLGIGGLAIAFALQKVLEDIFASFSIYFDKPFEIGDYIVIGTDMGTVEKIGIKTTRIRTLQGQQLVVSNRELTESRVNNFKKMDRRRIVWNFGVEYSTPVQKLEKILKIVDDIFKKNKMATLDRVHFKEFGDFSLNFEVVYFVESKEYKKYMDTQQDVNFELARRFQKEKIEFAFPTQTIHVKK